MRNVPCCIIEEITIRSDLFFGTASLKFNFRIELGMELLCEVLLQFEMRIYQF